MAGRRRLLTLTMGLALAAGCAADLRRDPRDQWSARAFLAAVRVYQQTLSPLMPAAGVRCRFTPTCSRYAAAVVARDGLPRGGWLALKRTVRCGPWTPAGTSDPP